MISVYSLLCRRKSWLSQCKRTRSIQACKNECLVLSGTFSQMNFVSLFLSLWSLELGEVSCQLWIRYSAHWVWLPLLYWKRVLSIASCANRSWNGMKKCPRRIYTGGRSGCQVCPSCATCHFLVVSIWTRMKICRIVSCILLLMLQQQVVVPCVTCELLTETTTWPAP